jgi:ribonuclease BN (tRNA processing enzyme)
LPRPWPAPEVTEITAGFTFQGDGWTLGSAKATHAQPILDCLGFSVEASGKKFVYSGDTGINDDITALSRDADLLLHWCYRGAGEVLHPALQAFSPDPGEVADMAQAVGVNRLLLSHFRIHMDSPHGHKRALDDLSERFEGEADIVEDLDVFDI